MISIIQAIILSVIQGITEWLPISSSGHLAIIQNFFNFQNLAFDVFLHLSSILAVIFLFRKDISKLIKNPIKNKTYIFYMLIAIIPIGIIGLLFKEEIEKTFSNLILIAIFFIISGIIVYLTKFTKEKKEKISFFDSLFIGFLQIISILPGISRSGTSISSGLFRKIKRDEAVKFSFLISIPIVLGASVIEFKDLALSNINILTLIISFITTFIFSILTIKFLIKIIKKEKFYLFGLYNIFIGLLILIIKL